MYNKVFNTISDDEILKHINILIDNYNLSCIETLKNITLEELFKNPYLSQIEHGNDAHALIRSTLQHHIGQSQHTIFGNHIEIFVKSVSEATYPGFTQPSADEGVDIVRSDNEGTTELIAVKSREGAFNSLSSKRQMTAFDKIKSRYKQKPDHLSQQIQSYILYLYGTKSTEKKGIIYRSGKETWEFLTGDTEFYLRVSRAIQKHTDMGFTDSEKQRRELFDQAVNRALENFFKYFSSNGKIDWEKVTRFCSDKEYKKELKKNVQFKKDITSSLHT